MQFRYFILEVTCYYDGSPLRHCCEYRVPDHLVNCCYHDEPGGSGYIRARMGREVPGNVTYISRPTPVQYSNNSDLQQTTVTMTHVDDKHHVTLDRLTKVTAMTRVFNLHPASS